MDEDIYSQTRLHKRNNSYYYRGKIPTDLKEHKFALRRTLLLQ